ncbi:hypothetical protein C1631_022865 [Chryseobacterium phosphatilyticum]|uniref:Conjugative transposon TraJ C-terminal domain-containing protein n=1 Tax=Chryseobacterium phosphatilyticum TaxID=475075 RepID=A0A316WUZ5_9FLAO|nr:hypothetical protein [Chryseobacterium phosphatilyticum]PWN62410.1 hypothetical protein C1631_022865 [Chryseobacterium phosphatilyticum]
MLTLLVSSYGVESIEVSTIVNNIFQSGGLNNITKGLKTLGYIALLIYFVTKITAVFSGSETITAKTFGPPIIYGLLLVSWNDINRELDSGLMSIQQEFQTATPKDSRSTTAYQDIIAKWSSVPSNGVPEQLPPTTADEESTSFWDFSKIKEKVTTIVDIMNNPEILMLKVIMFGTHVFNTVIVMLFNAFSYIWINLLRIGGIVALALYFFPTFKGTFTNWLRTYISVYLWIPIGSIMIYVSDQIFLEIVSKVGNFSMPGFAPGVVMDPETIMKMTFLVISAVATTILKLILLSKVPNVISYWLGGGNSGDMFSAAPTMVMMSTSVAGSAANAGGQVAAGVLTGGASAAGSIGAGAASAASGAASKGSESLKG